MDLPTPVMAAIAISGKDFIPNAGASRSDAW